MNKQEKDILNTLYHQSVNNQREISELSGHSLGVVNKSIKELMNEGYINEKLYVWHDQNRVRTCDILLVRQALSQLSYSV